MFPGQAALSLPDDLQLRAALGLVRSFRGGFCLLLGSCVHRRGLGGGRRIGFLLVEGVVALRRALHGGLAAVGLRGGGARAAECVCEVSVCKDKEGRAGLTSPRAPGSRQIKQSCALGARGATWSLYCSQVTPSRAPADQLSFRDCCGQQALCEEGQRGQRATQHRSAFCTRCNLNNAWK